jgi:HK97 family phage portal protein
MSFWGRLAGGVAGFVNRVVAPARVAVKRYFNVGRTAAGVYVDADRALRDATVWACGQYLAKTIAQLTWHAMRATPGGGGEVASTHPADWLIWKRPNPEMGSFLFRFILMWWAIFKGNGYAEIERDNRGAPYALWPIHPDRVEPKRRDGTGELFYRVWDASGGGYVDLDAMDMFHIRGFGDGIVGVSVIEYAAESIGWALATQVFGSTYFGEGMNPTGVVEVQRALSGDAMKILREELEAVYKGPKGKRTAILDAGMAFKKVSQTPDESQFIETRQHQVEEICRWFGVPPHKVMHLLRATFSNIEHQSIEVVVDSITPWVKIWEDEADYKLFGPQNRQGLYTKMNLKSLMRGDAASRADYYTKLWGIGALTINGILRAEDENPIGPEGDTRFVPANMMTLERAIAAGATATTPAGQQSLPVPEPEPNQPSE